MKEEVYSPSKEKEADVTQVFVLPVNISLLNGSITEAENLLQGLET